MPIYNVRWGKSDKQSGEIVAEYPNWDAAVADLNRTNPGFSWVSTYRVDVLPHTEFTPTEREWFQQEIT